MAYAVSEKTSLIYRPRAKYSLKGLLSLSSWHSLSPYINIAPYLPLINKHINKLVTINIGRTIIVIWNHLLKIQHKDSLPLYTEEHQPVQVLVRIIISSGLNCIGQPEATLLNVSTGVKVSHSGVAWGGVPPPILWFFQPLIKTNAPPMGHTPHLKMKPPSSENPPSPTEKWSILPWNDS